MKQFILFSCVILMSGCGSPNDPGVGGVTKAEADQLNEAAEALNQDKPPPRLSDVQGKVAPAPPTK